jgi:hypothetical protein
VTEHSLAIHQALMCRRKLPFTTGFRNFLGLIHRFGWRPDILAGFLCCAMSAEMRLMEAGTVPEHPATRHFRVS